MNRESEDDQLFAPPMATLMDRIGNVSTAVSAAL
jgi:hypothetical protein